MKNRGTSRLGYPKIFFQLTIENTFDYPMLFCFLDHYLSTTSPNERARLDGTLYNMLADLRVLYEICQLLTYSDPPMTKSNSQRGRPKE